MRRFFGLIGFPLGHSLSKLFFSEKFEKENINAQYDLYELSDISLFPELIKNNSLSGLNVTIPYKESIIPFLDELDDTASAIGAVNVIKFIQKNGKTRLKGYNSDAVGFELSLKPYLSDFHRKALILGTGGASKAVNYTLKKLGIDTQFVSRNKKAGLLNYDHLDEKIISEHLLIVNASPVGTYPNIDKAPEIPYQYLSEKHLLYDLVYNPPESSFMKNGIQYGAKAVNGKKMFTAQANTAWEIWNG